jgi:Cd2+/Zn2+-exporting ATPase
MNRHNESHPHNCGCHHCHPVSPERHSREENDSGGDDDDHHQPLVSKQHLHDHSHEADIDQLKDLCQDVMKSPEEIQEEQRKAFGHYHVKEIHHGHEGHDPNCQCEECVTKENECDQCGFPLSLCHCDFLGKDYHLYIFHLQSLDCPLCTARIEQQIRRLPVIFFVALSYRTKEMRIITRAPAEDILPSIREIIDSIDPDVTVEPADQNQDTSLPEEKKKEEPEHAGESEEEAREPKHEEESSSRVVQFFQKKWILTLSILLCVFGIAGFYLHFIPYDLSVSLLVLSYLFLGVPIFWSLGMSISHGEWFDENVLMTIATAGALAIGEYPEAAGVLLFYRIGEYLEDEASDRSRRQITEALDLRPETVSRLHGETAEVIPAEEARIGDVLLIRPGDRIPLDGMISDGTSTLDTSPLTGEPVPVSVGPGSQIQSGCINQDGTLHLIVSRELSESMVSRILRAVEDAVASRPHMERFITRFSKIYTPVVVLIALLTAVIPPLFFGQSWNTWIYTALTFLVISCPCALVISIPLSFFAGIGAASKRSMLFKSGQVMETLSHAKAVVMDKTGTLTTGTFSVTEVHAFSPWEESQILSMAASLEGLSTHPIAHSIVKEANNRQLTIPSPENVHEEAGHGVRGTVSGQDVFVGNQRMMKLAGIDTASVEAPPVGSLIYVGVGTKLAGTILIRDTLKPDSREAVARIHSMGLVPVMLTGDAEQPARAIAKEAGISEVYGGLLPEDKLRLMKDIRQKFGPVFYIGDGINDAPVLAGADAGAAMGSGADAAISIADIVFLTSKASSIPDSIALSRKVLSTAHNNAIFAIGVKTLIMILGFAGFANMWLAVFADTGVTLLCVLYASRLLYIKK